MELIFRFSTKWFPTGQWVLRAPAACRKEGCTAAIPRLSCVFFATGGQQKQKKKDTLDDGRIKINDQQAFIAVLSESAGFDGNRPC